MPPPSSQPARPQRRARRPARVRAVGLVVLTLTWLLLGGGCLAAAATRAAAPLAGDGALRPTAGRWPLEPPPELVRGFDPPDVPWGAGHRGVDLLGHVGQPVHAALAGRVTFAGRVAGRGVVVVDHGGFRTTYEPVAADAAVGDDVDPGQVIGRLSWFGTHCPPRSCLHWGLVEGSTYLDPLSLVGGGPRPVRLLPLTGGSSSLRLPLTPQVPLEPVPYGHRGTSAASSRMLLGIP